MRSKFMLLMLALLVMLCLPSLGVARQIHDFDCANCHKPGSSLSSVGNILCLDCHDGTHIGTTYPLLKTGPGDTGPISNASFAIGDASDAMGSVTAQAGNGTPGDENSHNWAAADKNPAAGATAPSNRRFYGRQNYSGATVNCGRCHDPHGYDTNPKLLKLGAGTEAAMCNDCHVDWASDTAPSEGGSAPTNVHPMVTDYATIAAAKPAEYNSVVDLNATAGEIALNGSGGIDCLSCHGVHFTDSDSSTSDGVGQSLNPGDGKVLKANGPNFDAAAVAGVSLCQTCHKYKDHGSGRSNPIGCLVCHGAHLEDTGGSMNNYMLRSSITTYMPNGGGSGTVSGLTANITDTPAQNTRLWNYCFDCHVEASAAITHNASWPCGDCHSHSDTDGSWTAAGGCNTCHGYPPSENAEANGSNSGYATGYDSSGHFKNELTTKHADHAGGGSDYSFSCSICHKNNDHIGGNFADAILAPYDPLIDGAGALTGASSPAYVTATGSCSNIYCHSNGNPRSNGTLTVNDPGVWDNGTAITTCDACHGNDSTDMVTRSNSATHIAHLDKGYNCQVCHGDTATSASALVAAAKGVNGVHVNGDSEVAFDGTSVSLDLSASSYGPTDGTCSVYCHSNGTTNVAPDWDTSSTGACGTCHQYDNGGVATGSGAALGGAHTAHVFATTGPQLACTICHTHDGSTGVANTDHVNGTVDKVTSYMDNVCNPCHGSTNGGTGDDAEPNWAVSSSVNCRTCHLGTVIADITGGVTTPSKAEYPITDHSIFTCLTCHNGADDGNHLGALGDTKRLYAAYNIADIQTLCDNCHGVTETNHYANTNTTDQATNTSTDGTNCTDCHDIHGQRDKNSDFLDALLRSNINGRVVTGFTDKTDRTSYYATGGDLGEGICQTCHDPNEVNNFNRTTANTSHGGTGNCISCHPHTTNPAFQASCNGCHGDTVTGRYWPDDGPATQVPTADQAGRHEKHMEQLASEVMGQSIVQLLADDAGPLGPWNPATSDAKQKALCEYCHAAIANDTDHGTASTAEVFVAAGGGRHAKSIWGAADANATYNASDTCSTTACHNNKTTTDGTYGWYDAGNSGCIMCHDNVTIVGTHSAHMNASGTYGLSIGCTDCHTASTAWGTAPDTGHWDGSWTISGSNIGAYTNGDWATSTPGTCGTNDCHNDGTGNQPDNNTYTWGQELSSCSLCHANVPTSGDHTVHLSGGYGPNLGTDCSGCHDASANNTSMAGKTTHMNGTVTFTDGGSALEVANGNIDDGSNTVDDCDACHGGAAAANIAKGYWFTADRVTCESCHTGTAAVIGGNSAPLKDNFVALGHGKVDPTAGPSPYGGDDCFECHDRTSNHIGTGAPDLNRLLGTGTTPTLAADYDSADANAFCSQCHNAGSGLEINHFDNTHTTAGADDSSDGDNCVICHDPHGHKDINNGDLDAMLNNKIGTYDLVGFADKGLRASYYVDPPNDAGNNQYGVCQVCHSGDEVGNFNRTTATTSHGSTSNCISCHTHTTAPAFKASCNGCHGDTVTGRYWPDDGPATQVPTADQAGRHEKHMEQLASEVMGQSITQLLTDDDGPLGPWNPATSDAKQKALCEYCHAAITNDTDHGAASTAEVFVAAGGGRHAKSIWGAADANATYNANDTCSATACHNNQTTTDGTYGWYDLGTSDCVMCHVDVPNDPASHTVHTDAPWEFACSVCHPGTPAWTDGANGTKSAPSTGHMNGILAISGSRFSSYDDGTGSCDTNECHNNGNMGAPVLSGYDWRNGKTNVSSCDTCHGFSMTSNDHATHSKANATGNGTKQFVQNAIGCSDCHYYSVANHLNGAINFQVGMNYSGNTAINDGGAFGTCDTSTCHNNGTLAVETPTWDNASSIADDCTICHAGVPATGSHSKHVKNTYTPSDYTNTTDATTAADYIFACSNCHGSTINNHINTTKNLDAGLGWSASTCTTSYCHSDGNGNYTDSPNWNAGTFPADKCAGCHGNSPTTNAHQVHEVGIHFDTLYDGTSGLLATGSTEPSAHGARWGDNVTGTSTVISCYLCHFDTVTVWYNDQNATCSACHGNTAPVKGDADIADKRKHVDGNKDVAFQAIKVASKAQLRNDITTVPEVDANWERIKDDGFFNAIVGLFYKENDSFDRAKTALDTATMYNSGAKTCSNISCHNGIDATWAAPAGDCSACHTTVSQ